MLFSQRLGFTKASDIILLEEVSDDLRNAIWNYIFFLLKNEGNNIGAFGSHTSHYLFLKDITQDIWIHYYKKRLDEYDFGASNCRCLIKDMIIEAKWFTLYDFIEIFYLHLKDYDNPYFQSKEKYVETINMILKQENSGYRLINGTITPVTDCNELQTIDEAISDKYKGCSTHLESALKKLSDRVSPDYRNSIKESISAVESIVNSLTNSSSLGSGLKKLEKKGLYISPLLKISFEKLYAYTNDEDGIRHAILDEKQITFDEAKFMLVSCSAFVNYLKAKNI